LKKLKIVHSQAYFQPHLGYQEYFLCKSMAKLGHDVHIITSDRFAPFIGFESLDSRIVGIGESKMDGFKVHRLPIYFESRGRVLYKNFFSKLFELNPDILVLHGTTNFSNLIPFIFHKRLKAKIIIDEHHFSIFGSKVFLTKIFYGLWGILYRKLIKNNRISLVGVAPKCCDFISEKFKIPKSKVYHIPLGADTNLFKPDDHQRREIRDSLKIKKEEIVVIYTGKINTEKNPFIILESCRNINIKNNIKFIFLGNISKSYSEKFKDVLESENINILPAVENSELPKYYNAADIACWPKHTSLSSLEAASCGLPIIISENVKERVSKGNGISIREENHNDIKNAILLLAGDKNLRKVMGEKGREYIKSNYSYDKIAKQFIELNLN
tara:strand:- start:349 stop:1500 length:1152 start_codon:yes stop_codon:yes gene_type:complete